MTNISFGIGRRKKSTAQVQIHTGSGNFYINEKLASSYFQKNQDLILKLYKPFFVSKNSIVLFDVRIKVCGGGLSGQANAISLAISRALLQTNSASRTFLKKQSLLTRDARIKERKKYGLKKARKASQFSKR